MVKDDRGGVQFQRTLDDDARINAGAIDGFWEVAIALAKKGGDYLTGNEQTEILAVRLSLCHACRGNSVDGITQRTDDM